MQSREHGSQAQLWWSSLTQLSRVKRVSLFSSKIQTEVLGQHLKDVPDHPFWQKAVGTGEGVTGKHRRLETRTEVQ